MVPPLLIRVLSHLVRLPGPNPSSIVPPAPCPLPPAPRSYYFIWVCLHRGSFAYQASSCLPRCLVTTAWEKAAKCIRLLSTLLYIYVFEPFVLFTKLQRIKHLRLFYECTANALTLKVNINETAFCLQRISHVRQESE